MYQQIYFHDRSGPSTATWPRSPPVCAGDLRDASPADDLGHYADLDDIRTCCISRALGSRRGDSENPAPGDGRSLPYRQLWRAILLRQPRWHAEIEIRRAYEAADREATIAAVNVSWAPRNRPGRRRPGRDRRPAGGGHGYRLAAGRGGSGRRARRAAERVAREIARLFARGQRVHPRGVDQGHARSVRQSRRRLRRWAWRREDRNRVPLLRPERPHFSISQWKGRTSTGYSRDLGRWHEVLSTMVGSSWKSPFRWG